MVQQINHIGDANKMITAVEWLDNELWKLRLKLRGAEISFDFYCEQEVKLIKQAKAMEKEQIEDAYWEGGQDVPMSAKQCKQYYNETYGE
jgi:hypothetical protein